MIIKSTTKNPAYDWYGMLAIFALALCILLIINIGVFFSSKLSSGTTTVSGPAETVVLKDEALAEAIKGIQQKDARVPTIPSAVRPDPSL